MITGLLRNMVGAHFSNPDFIEEPQLKSLLWNTEVTTGIMIESVDRYRADIADKRPAILIKRNRYTNLRISRLDEYGPDGQGNPHYQTLWLGSHSLFCIHGSGASCEILATEVQRELTQFGPAVVDQLGLKKFQVVEVGAVAEVEESTQNFAVPITLGWCYEEKWKLTAEQLKLTAVALALNVRELG